MKVLIFDTETTGLPPSRTFNKGRDVLDKWPYIVQLSYILYDTDKNEIIHIRDNIIKLPSSVQMTPENMKIHGITHEIINRLGKEKNVVLMQFIQDCINIDRIVAHNLSFDLLMIQAEMERLNIDYYNDFYATINKKLYCTMQASIDMCKLIRTNKQGKDYNKFPTLSELHLHLFGTVPCNLHNALNDVIICLRCFYKINFDKDIFQQNVYIKELASPLFG